MYPKHLDYIELIQKSGETYATISIKKPLDAKAVLNVSSDL